MTRSVVLAFLTRQAEPALSVYSRCWVDTVDYLRRGSPSHRSAPDVAHLKAVARELVGVLREMEGPMPAEVETSLKQHGERNGGMDEPLS